MDILSARKKAAKKKGENQPPLGRAPETTGVPEERDVRQEGAPEAGHDAVRIAEPEMQPTPDIGSRSEAQQDMSNKDIHETGCPTAEAPPETKQSGVEASGTGPSEIELLAFKLGREMYAVPIAQVREVMKLWAITPVPNSPGHVLGVTTLRGAVLPVIDLCRILGIPEGQRGEKSRIVVASINDERTGIVVDRVEGVIRIREDEIRPAPETIEQKAGAEYLKGIVRRDERLYILIDLEKAAGM